MSVIFSGTFTQNNGRAAAAGSVAITPDGEGATTVTMKADGSIVATTVADGTGPNFTVVISITNGPTITKVVRAADAATVDLSLDAGVVGGLHSFLGANHLYINTGAPTSTTAPGAVDGDVYFRVDGTAAANTAIYHHEAAAWVAAVTS